jgi:hypothetical protein
LHPVELALYPITVLDYQGHPIKDAKITAMCGLDYIPEGITNEQGIAKINLSELKQPFLLFVHCPGNNASINARYENPPPATGITVLLPCNEAASPSPPDKMIYIPPMPS